jgi:hypothetical protein
MNGYGVYRYKSGDVYEGDRKDDKIHGYGVYQFTNGDIY